MSVTTLTFTEVHSRSATELEERALELVMRGGARSWKVGEIAAELGEPLEAVAHALGELASAGMLGIGRPA